jgi:hypothetical protein
MTLTTIAAASANILAMTTARTRRSCRTLRSAARARTPDDLLGADGFIQSVDKVRELVRLCAADLLAEHPPKKPNARSSPNIAIDLIAMWDNIWEHNARGGENMSSTVRDRD